MIALFRSIRFHSILLQVDLSACFEILNFFYIPNFLVPVQTSKTLQVDVDSVLFCSVLLSWHNGLQVYTT